ncbi:MAG: methylenetetrahydrofolate--tRNA-(uracil(54)-C(5))-methyltransferase (FADH(2)-oxidizing) TrmFO [Erysipelotrichaceae bacterium]|nr:methylenetetrahydrofolate--tRNA-(uracil(54)-C(5))-methyltransferase (FADH(2)-oxidizing) TrmFO [Erysipelotrichaceae bacterium]
MKPVHVIGAGLAGSEAAWQLAKRNIPVILHEMRPVKSTPAHTGEDFAELVCSNSLRSNSITNGVGLLKEEMRRLSSLIMEAADATSLPAGSALAVDRHAFSRYITDKVSNHPLITVIKEEVTELPDEPTIIASGPLTSDALATAIQGVIHNESLYFYDAAAPIVEKDSIDFNIAYSKSRYDEGDGDYINCPMTKAEFDAFYDAVLRSEKVPLRQFEKEIYFEGCMPFEEMARRGPQTLIFGPMKPVGLEKDGVRPYAVVQLRQDDAAASLYNIVGFQTHLTWGEQKRILRMIPGLQNAEFARFGVMHRNTYLKSPVLLKQSYQFKDNPDWFFAGQMTGVEGYVESAASGLMAGSNLAHWLVEGKTFEFGATCMIGAMAQYIATANPASFQPMNANFGIMVLKEKTDKADRKEALVRQALKQVESFVETETQWNKKSNAF